MREKTGKHNRWNFGAKDGDGKMIYVAKLTDIRLSPFRHRIDPNPYLAEEVVTPVRPATLDTPFRDSGSNNYNPKKTEWLETRQLVLERDNYRCVRCGSVYPPHYIHHILAQKEGGKDNLDNLETLCHKCHVQTESYGRNRTG